jgi:hypothetical protein
VKKGHAALSRPRRETLNGICGHGAHVVRNPHQTLIAYLEGRMGTTAMVANSTVRLSPGWNAVYYWGVWAICIIG